ncbi:MAG: homoserine/homoserine lactone efflux protein [Desulforhopalus sp.]
MINEYLIYVTLAVTIVAIPGPAVILTVKNSIKYGFKISVAGILGNFVAMIVMATISAFGLGAIITASASLFSVLKVMGCLYLVYLGIEAWRTPLQKSDSQTEPNCGNNKEFFTVFKQGVWVGISNPKAIAFFVALFPQFIDPARSYLPQFLTLILTIEGISCCILSLYALLSSRAAHLLYEKNSMHIFHKLTGGAFIGFGFALLYEK